MASIFPLMRSALHVAECMLMLKPCIAPLPCMQLHASGQLSLFQANTNDNVDMCGASELRVYSAAVRCLKVCLLISLRSLEERTHARTHALPADTATSVCVYWSPDAMKC